MPDATLTSALAQLGAAGLIGWMWLTERRGAAVREKQLSETHERVMQERTAVTALLAVVSDNTRALASLEAGQRALQSVLERPAASVRKED